MIIETGEKRAQLVPGIRSRQGLAIGLSGQRKAVGDAYASRSETRM